MPGHASDRYAELALLTWLDELVADRRVLWLGDAEGEAPDRLAERARSVLVLAATPPPKSASKHRGARISALKPGPLAFRPNSFDVVIVPDLAAVGLDDEERIAELRDVVGEEGVLVAGIAAEGPGLGYDGLFDLLAERFPEVRMLGQGLFRGYAIVDLAATAEGDYEVTFDGSLAEEEQPAERWIAVAAADGPTLDAYCVIQVPASAAPAVEAPRRTRRSAEPDPRVSELEERLRERQAEVDAANEHAEQLEQAVTERTGEVTRLREELDARARELEELRAEIERRQSEPPPRDAEEDAQLSADYDRLEQALADQGARVLELGHEIERRGTLVRDLVEELREARRGGGVSDGGGGGGVPREDVDAAIERAVAAEAARAEAQFQIDELMGRLSQAGDPEELEELRTREARLAGTVRGLRSRVAEVEELRELAEGRLAVAQLDLDEQRRRNLDLQRELGELREQFELELVRARGPAQGGEDADALRASEHHLSRRVGELSGQLVACRDLAMTLTDERDHARAENLRLTALVGSLEDRFEGARRGYEARIAELLHDGSADAQRELRTLRYDLAVLRGERDGLRARLADREAALAAGGSASGLATEEARAEAARLRAEIERLRLGDADLSARVADAEDRARREADRAAELQANAAARDALVTRLQMDLAQEESRRQEMAQRLARSEEETERLRGALLDASEQVDEALAVEERQSGLEQTLRSAQDALSETRAVLAGLADALGGPEAGARSEITAVGVEAPDGAADGDATLLRKRVAELEEQLADQETLMRSLTAQIEERDDRVRALERRLEGSVGVEGDEEALRRELMELQERAARLSDELLHERKARRAAEAEAKKRVGPGQDEVRRLHERLGQSDAELLLLKGQHATAERDLRALREACEKARNGLEELLGAATANGDPATAERLGSLIRLLNRF